MDFFSIFTEEYLLRALLASSLVGIVCGVLGVFIFLKGMALVGDALSHAILPGVVAGYLFFGENALALFIGAVVAGVITAFLIAWVQNNSLIKKDSSVGIVFTGMFALGIIGISWLTKKGGIHMDMKDFLFGSILGVSNEDLWLTGIIGAFVILSIVILFRQFFLTSFDPIFANIIGISSDVMHYFLMLLLSLTVVSALQSVGIILVVAMLIVPASTAYLLTNQLKKMIAISAFVGLISSFIGLYLAILVDTTPGPTMTLVAVFIFTLVLMTAPEKGLLVKYFRSLKFKRQIILEDIVKEMFKFEQKGSTDLRTDVCEKLALTQIKMDKSLRKLRKRGLVIKNKFELTEEGHVVALELIRAHRLWETYLAQKLGVSRNEVHPQAEKYEHLIPKEILDKIEAELSFPELDPHGSPIPKKK